MFLCNNSFRASDELGWGFLAPPVAPKGFVGGGDSVAADDCGHLSVGRGLVAHSENLATGGGEQDGFVWLIYGVVTSSCSTRAIMTSGEEVNSGEELLTFPSAPPDSLVCLAFLSSPYTSGNPGFLGTCPYRICQSGLTL